MRALLEQAEARWTTGRLRRKLERSGPGHLHGRRRPLSEAAPSRCSASAADGIVRQPASRTTRAATTTR